MASYRKEKTILAIAYILSGFLLIKFVPKDKLRQASIAFLFKQLMTWIFGLVVVESKLIEYPYRPFFRKTYKASFDFEYVFYPVTCVLFNLYYPKDRNKMIKFLYYFFHSSIITGVEVLLVKYTRLIRYKKWKWYMSFITMWLTNHLSHLFYEWFFKEDKVPGTIQKTGNS